jgi:small subunit ribosomal protein S4
VARYRDAVCRLCRRESAKLYLKGERCYTEKCAIERRSYAPGDHGRRRKARAFGYGLQLREKQKVKSVYGMLEKQFRIYFSRAERKKGITGENLLGMLEKRLDNVVYRIGFCSSRRQARQMVSHGHILVNDRKVNIPSYQVAEGEVISVKEKSRKIPVVLQSIEAARSRSVPEWIEVNYDNFQGKIVRLPEREDITMPIQEHMIVELYSK